MKKALKNPVPKIPGKEYPFIYLVRVAGSIAVVVIHSVGILQVLPVFWSQLVG